MRLCRNYVTDEYWEGKGEKKEQSHINIQISSSSVARGQRT